MCKDEFFITLQKKKERDSEMLAENANKFFGPFLKDCKNSIAKHYLLIKNFKLKILILQIYIYIFCKYQWKSVNMIEKLLSSESP